MQHAHLKIKKVWVYFKNQLQCFIIFKNAFHTEQFNSFICSKWWDTAIPVPEYDDWDWEIAMDPYPSGRLRDIDGRLVYMFDYKYEQYLQNLEDQKEEKEEAAEEEEKVEEKEEVKEKKEEEEDKRKEQQLL